MTARELRTRRRAEERKARKEGRLLSRAGLQPSQSSSTPPLSAPTKPGQSTGPRSSTGKAISSRNSFKHGLASGAIVVPGEDPAAFEALLNDLTADHAPANSTEELLVHEMAQSYWLMQRASRLQNTCWAGGEVDGKQLALFLRYRTTYERAFHKALNTLISLKKQRESANRQFVSQNSRKQVRPPSDEAAFLSGPEDRFVEPSEPKTQREFVRQKTAGFPHQVDDNTNTVTICASIFDLEGGPSARVGL